MLLQSVFTLSARDSDVPLCDRGRTVLQKLLDENDVVVVVFI